MARDRVDVDHLTVTGAKPRAESVTVQDDVLVIINQAFGPTGERLVGTSDEQFDGFPAITLLVRAGSQEGLVHLSPIHGDRRKRGFTDIAPGTKCELFCPASRQPLHKIGSVPGDENAEYYALYLSPKLNEGSMVYISDVWDHYHSRVIDNHELISAWAAADEG